MNNQRTVRIVAVVVIAMMVLTLAASLFGCAPQKQPTATPSVDPVSGLRYVAVAALPKEAQDTLKLIDKGGPFPYNRDGIVFGNRERLLPKQSNGYYHEYTVKTPGERDRGARRIITGKGEERYYTDDHYASFRRIAEDNG